MTIDLKLNTNPSKITNLCEEPIAQKIDKPEKHDHKIKTKANTLALNHTSISMMEHYIK